MQSSLGIQSLAVAVARHFTSCSGAVWKQKPFYGVDSVSCVWNKARCNRCPIRHTSLPVFSSLKASGPAFRHGCWLHVPCHALFDMLKCYLILTVFSSAFYLIKINPIGTLGWRKQHVNVIMWISIWNRQPCFAWTICGDMTDEEACTNLHTVYWLGFLRLKPCVRKINLW